MRSKCGILFVQSFVLQMTCFVLSFWKCLNQVLFLIWSTIMKSFIHRLIQEHQNTPIPKVKNIVQRFNERHNAQKLL